MMHHMMSNSSAKASAKAYLVKIYFQNIYIWSNFLDKEYKEVIKIVVINN